MKQLMIAVALMTSLTFGCAAATNTNDTLVTENGFTQVSNTRFDSLSVASEFQAQKQKRVFIQDMNVNNIEIDEQFSMRHSMGKKWQLDEKELAQLQQLYSQSMKDYFTVENGFTVTSNADEADYVIHAKLTEINPTAPKDDMKSRQLGTQYLTQGSGSMAIEFDIYQAGKLVMSVEDKSDAGNSWERNDWSSNAFNTRVLFKKWARQLSSAL